LEPRRVWSVRHAAFTRNSAEAFWGDDFNYKLNARTSFVEKPSACSTIFRHGEYRINADIGATTQLTKWLNWNVSLSDRFEQPGPVPQEE
jgi:hypothetical protein